MSLAHSVLFIGLPTPLVRRGYDAALSLCSIIAPSPRSARPSLRRYRCHSSARPSLRRYRCRSSACKTSHLTFGFIVADIAVAHLLVKPPTFNFLVPLAQCPQGTRSFSVWVTLGFAQMRTAHSVQVAGRGLHCRLPSPQPSHFAPLRPLALCPPGTRGAPCISLRCPPKPAASPTVYCSPLGAFRGLCACFLSCHSDRFSVLSF